ncbi:hypothetical protein, partial [Mesorhizobium sp. M1D.F.Ca.ET.234.01.1.1]|uniref:hypothetical protein n=1 Tax=Mesorhizobium sp. M1D.F.Ca.ET.234.01.1.1 TaxID=2563932 RepID=UPI001AED1319
RAFPLILLAYSIQPPNAAACRALAARATSDFRDSLYSILNLDARKIFIEHVKTGLENKRLGILHS